MGISDRKARARQRLRQRILAAAERLFLKEGYENVSMRQIARQIEYSPTTIYHHFRDKGELFFHLLESYHGMLLERMDRIYSRGGDPLALLKKGMRAYVEFGLANRSYYRLAFMSPPEFKAESYMVKGTKGTALFQTLQHSVDACLAAGRLRRMDPDLVAQVIWTMNHGVTSLLITNPNFPWVNRDMLIDQVIDSAVDGLRSLRGSPRSGSPRKGKKT